MPLTVEERKARMKARRGLQRRLARKLDVSESYISKVIRGDMTGSQRVRREIARHLQMAVADVFPPDVRATEPSQLDQSLEEIAS